MTKRERIRACLSDLLADRDDTRPFDDEQSLLLSGRLDSICVLSILSVLEREYGFSIAPEDFDQARFDSVASILELVGEA